MDIKPGQGFKYQVRNGFAYGLITGVSNTSIGWIPVVNSVSKFGSMKAFDEYGAKRSIDKDHVRLRSCPPPFSVIGSYQNYKHESVSNSIALADMDRVQIMTKNEFLKSATILDDGVTISDKDMETVYNHPWPSQQQKERIRSDKSELNLDDDNHRYMDHDFDISY